MKLSHFRLALLFVLALLAFGCNGNRVGVVNTEIVYKDSAAAEKGTEYLRGITTEMQQEFLVIQEKAQSNKDKNAGQAEMQQALMELQQRLNAEQQQVVTVLSELYTKAMETVRTKYKLDVIIPTEAALSYSPDADVTRKVMEEMNASPVTFTPLSTERPLDANEPETGSNVLGQPAQ